MPRTEAFRPMLSLACAAAIALAPCVAAAQAQGGARAYAYSFADADVASVADEILGQALKLPFTVDPAVSGKITLRIERRLTPDQLLAAFEAALAQNGASLVRGADGVYAIVPRAKARSSASLRSGGGGRAGYQVVAEPLKFAAPSDVAKVLSDMGAGDVVLHADDKLGLIVLGGTSSEIRSARETIAVFDRSGLSAARSRVVTLRVGAADAVASDIERLAKAADLGGVVAVPLRQMNAVVLLARSAATLDQLEAWTLRLDQPSAEEPTTLWVYRPRNVAAEALVEALRALSDSAGGVRASPPRTDGDLSPGPAPEAARPVESPAAFDPNGLRVSVERSTNSLLVMAPASRWRSLLSALQQLDRAPDQVLIEATVLEVTLNRDFRLGVDWSLVSADGKLASTLSRAETGDVAPAYPGISLTYLNTGVRAVVSALASRTNVEVMSAPKLLALDNQTASLQVGDQVPIVIQRAQGTGAPGAPLVTTTEYRDTGVILKIKPRINGDRNVLLEVSQEVSDVARTTTSGIDSPTIQQRRFESSLSLQEGQTLAIGGLISSARNTNSSGVPWLKDVPVAGALFRTNTNGSRRTELIVLLSARIVRSAEDGRASTEALKGAMDEIGHRGLLERR
jgi:general secretion pathway protein D